ncbi:MAG: hypothetical protein VX359_02435 [Chloroflexota bacterium]
MNYSKDENISEKAKQLAPISDEEIEQLKELLYGVRMATELMESLVQTFEQEIDVLKMSSTVDGEN